MGVEAVAEKAVGNGISLYSSILIAGIVIGVVAGIGVGIYKVMQKTDDIDQFSYAYLVKNQTVVDVLNGSVIAAWFQENRKLAKENACFFLAKPSADTSRMFALDRVPNNLDAEHCLLQCVVDESSNLPVAIRLISFSKMSEKLISQLEGKEYIIISDN